MMLLEGQSTAYRKCCLKSRLRLTVLRIACQDNILLWSVSPASNSPSNFLTSLLFLSVISMRASHHNRLAETCYCQHRSTSLERVFHTDIITIHPSSSRNHSLKRVSRRSLTEAICRYARRSQGCTVS